MAPLFSPLVSFTIESCKLLFIRILLTAYHALNGCKTPMTKSVSTRNGSAIQWNYRNVNVEKANIVKRPPRMSMREYNLTQGIYLSKPSGL